MVYFKKSQPAPESLKKERQKERGDYNKSDVVEQLKKDFCNKCYICEHKATSFNIEHFKPHKGDKNLKFDWNNLFLACSHCNNIKGHKHINILDCTNINDNVDKNIAYHFNPFPKEKARFEALSQDQKTKNTVKLLNEVFNGETALKNIDSINLNGMLLLEIKQFQDLLIEYYQNDDKEYFLKKIQTHLNKRSQFTAFKRHIVRNCEEMREDLEKYIQDED